MTVSKTNDSGSLPRGFAAIPLATLRLDEMTDFDLYLLPADGRKPVLYRKGSQPLTEDARKRLQENRVASLLVRTEDESAYRRYVEHHLGEILADASIPLEQRSGTMYSSAKGLVKDVLEDPRSGDLLERSGQLVDHMVSFIFAEGHSFQQLMRVTSFDYYTYTHSVNVFVFSTALAQRVGFDEEQVRVFGLGALLHDVGKSDIDPDIVNCRGRLSPSQWKIMKQHPVLGHQILIEQGETNEVVLDVTRHHHEKLDGSGYPDGLAGDEIAPWTRVSTIADIFDALTTRRSYKTAMDSFPSLRLMKEEFTGAIDADIFRTFVELMGRAG